MNITSAELCTLTGLTYRQVDFWTRAGYITPLGDPCPGHGNHRLFDEHQIALAVQMARLTRAGIPPALARQLAIDLTHFGIANLDSYELRPIHEASLTAPALPENVHPIHREVGAA